MKTKFNKDSRNLLIAMLLGDGTISNNYVFKLSHSEKQRDYLEWKIKLLNRCGIKNNGIKEYISSYGFNKGKIVLYTLLSIIPFIKVLRRIMYKPNKTIKRKLLNRLSAEGIAIWYMDNGSINLRRNKKGNIIGFHIYLHTCISKEQNQIIIDYFKEVYDISFYIVKAKKNKDYYSLCCGTKEGIKFINLVKPYVQQVPSLLYKIQYDLSQK